VTAAGTATALTVTSGTVDVKYKSGKAILEGEEESC